MEQVAIQAVPSQTVKVVLGAQNCEIAIRQKPQGMFVDVVSDGVTVAAGTIARDMVPLVCCTYTGFVGNLVFVDTHGSADPEHSGLGARFSLVYLSAAEYALFH